MAECLYSIVNRNCDKEPPFPPNSPVLHLGIRALSTHLRGLMLVHRHGTDSSTCSCKLAELLLQAKENCGIIDKESHSRVYKETMWVKCPSRYMNSGVFYTWVVIAYLWLSRKRHYKGDIAPQRFYTWYHDLYNFI